MTVAELFNLARLHAQDTNSAATRQPIGTTNYLLIGNDVARLWRSRIDTRVQYVNHTQMGGPAVDTVAEFSTDGTPSIRQVVAAYFLDSGVGANATRTSVIDGEVTQTPLRFLPPHKIKRLIAGPGVSNYAAYVAALRSRELYYSYEFLSGETGKVHLMFNVKAPYVSLEARLYHTDWTAIDSTVVDASNDDVSAMALAIGKIAASLLDKEDKYLQSIDARLPEVWRTVFKTEWDRLIADRRRESGDARSTQ
jgi:hypothetical protein